MMDKYKRVAPLAGVLMVALVVVTLSMPQTPDSNASGEKVVAFFTKHHDAMNVASSCIVYAGVVAVLYFLSVASFLRRHGSQLLATATGVGGIITASGLLVGGGMLFAANDAVKHQAPATAQALNILQDDAFVPLMFAGVGIATLCMGVAMLRTRALPKALGIITTIVGVAAFSWIGAWFAFLASGPLTLVIAGYVYVRSGRPDEITLPEVPKARESVETAPAKARAKA